MSEGQNAKIIQDAYSAFGRGDIPSVLANLDDNVSWQPMTGSKNHPLAGIRRGKPQVAEFFKRLTEVQTFEQFEPREFIAQGDRVVVLGHYRGRAKNGGIFDSDWSMVYRLKNGKVIEFQEFSDVVGIDAAFAGVAV